MPPLPRGSAPPAHASTSLPMPPSTVLTRGAGLAPGLGVLHDQLVVQVAGCCYEGGDGRGGALLGLRGGQGVGLDDVPSPALTGLKRGGRVAKQGRREQGLDERCEREQGTRERMDRRLNILQAPRAVRGLTRGRAPRGPPGRASTCTGCGGAGGWGGGVVGGSGPGANESSRHGWSAAW